MLEVWCEAGFDPDAFWRQTPRSTAAALAGAGRRSRREFETAIRAAHATAYLGRVAKLRDVDQYLPREPGPRSRTSHVIGRLKALKAAGAPMTITHRKRIRDAP